MSIIAVGVMIAILVFKLTDKPLYISTTEALNTDTSNAISDIEYFAAFTRAFKKENEAIKATGKGT
jgi:hypothetical protein